jgi:hypothetical protein
MRDLKYNPELGDLFIENGDFVIATDESTDLQNGTILLDGSILSYERPYYGININRDIGSSFTKLDDSMRKWSTQVTSDGAVSNSYTIDGNEPNLNVVISCKYPTEQGDIPELNVPDVPTTTESVNRTVLHGETIIDICLKETGNIINLESIIRANNYNSASPVINGGDNVIIPAGLIIDNNTLIQFDNYDNLNFADTGTIPDDDLNTLISDFEALMPPQI